MRPSEVLKQLKELREVWSNNSFNFTPEQQKQFDRLQKLRRERIKYFHDNGLVWKAGMVKPAPTPKPNEDES